MNFIIGIIQSLISSFIFSAYSAEKITASKESFEERARLFYSSISPFLIKSVLPVLAPRVSDKLYKFTHDSRVVICPFILFSSGTDLTISNHLQTNGVNFHENDNFISWLRDKLGKQLTNDPTFTLNSISTQNKLSVSIGNYYSTLSTSDFHYFNLIRYFPVKSKIGTYFAYRHSKYVKGWIESLKLVSESKSFSHYCASIGCSVLTVMKSVDGQYKYLLKSNSAEKNSAHDRHVIPSFMFQPISTRIYEQERELDLELSVIREYGEELLGIDELESAETVDALMNHISKNKLLNEFSSLLKSKQIHLEITGLVLDIYRLRPEITFLLIIHDDKFSRNIKTNWETKKKSLDMVSLHDDDAYHKIIDSQKEPLCPPGLAALINGRNRAIRFLSSN